MGWAAKFGTGFFQGAAASLPGALEAQQQRKDEERRGQLQNYLGLLQEVEDPAEASSLLSQWESDPNFQALDSSAKSRIRTAATGVGQLVGAKKARKASESITQLSSLGKGMETIPEDAPLATYEKAYGQLQDMRTSLAALEADPAMAQDPKVQEQRKQLDLLQATLDARYKGKQQRENTLVSAKAQIESMLSNPETTQDSAFLSTVTQFTGKADPNDIDNQNWMAALKSAREAKALDLAREKAEREATLAANRQATRDAFYREMATSPLTSPDLIYNLAESDPNAPTFFKAYSHWLRSGGEQAQYLNGVAKTQGYQRAYEMAAAMPDEDRAKLPAGTLDTLFGMAQAEASKQEATSAQQQQKNYLTSFTQEANRNILKLSVNPDTGEIDPVKLDANLSAARTALDRHLSEVSDQDEVVSPIRAAEDFIGMYQKTQDPRATVDALLRISGPTQQERRAVYDLLQDKYPSVFTDELYNTYTSPYFNSIGLQPPSLPFLQQAQ